MPSPLPDVPQETFQALAPVFDELERVPKFFELGKADASFKQRDRAVPWSCTLEEGLIMERVAKAMGATQGFEIATAFGFSALFLARALKPQNGRLLTVDCYIEETKGSCVYSSEEISAHVAEVRAAIERGQSPGGLTRAKELARLAGVADAIDFGVGASPQDIPALVGDRRFDIVHIDGGHFGDQPTKDIDAVLPFLQPRCAVFFHDDNNEWVERAVKRAESALGSRAWRFDTYYSLTMVARNLTPAVEAVVAELEGISRPLWWHAGQGIKQRSGWLKRFLPMQLIRECLRRK